MTRPVLALHAGGTKLAGAMVLGDGGLTFSQRVSAPAEAEAGFDALGDLADRVIRSAGSPVLQGIGVSAVTDWGDFPLRHRLEARYPNLPVRVQDDAVCCAVAEHWLGAARGSANMLGMVLSTEIGGGLILDGRLIS